MTAITSPVEAETAIADAAGLIEKLREVVERESALVKAGKVRAAAALGPSKGELAGQLYVLSERLRGNAKFLAHAAPASCTRLGLVQETFRATLRKNMIVLATAHAVSEGIVRRLSGDLARKTMPKVYGASGRTTAPKPRQGQPLAISRVL